jgi:hypothetical protein
MTDNARLSRPDNVERELLCIQYLQKTADLHSSHLTNKVDINPQLLKNVTFQTYIHATGHVLKSECRTKSQHKDS